VIFVDRLTFRDAFAFDDDFAACFVELRA